MSNDAVSSPALMLSHSGCDAAVSFGVHARNRVGLTPRTKARWPSTLTAPAETVWIACTPATRRIARSCFGVRVCAPVTSRVASTSRLGRGTAVTDSLIGAEAEVSAGAGPAGAGAEGRASVARCCAAARDLCGGGVAPWRTVAAPAPVASVMTAAVTIATGAAARSRPRRLPGRRDGRVREGKRRCTVAPPLPLAPGGLLAQRDFSPRVTRRKRPGTLGAGRSGDGLNCAAFAINDQARGPLQGAVSRYRCRDPRDQPARAFTATCRSLTSPAYAASRSWARRTADGWMVASANDDAGAPSSS